MKILIACDKFKGSLSAKAVGQAIAKGIQNFNGVYRTKLHPMADGGDGSLDILSDHFKLKEIEVDTIDPLGKPIKASYCISDNKAFIEVAKASGLVLIPEEKRNPLKASTIGTGMLIKDALSKSIEQIYLFLGGSATNDAGLGIAQMLGFNFYDKNNRILVPNGGSLIRIANITNTSRYDFDRFKIHSLCDVKNPLFGESGAARVYAGQKGADDDAIKILDDGLQNIAQVIKKLTEVSIETVPGGGAAGGIAAGLFGLIKAPIKNGFEVISELTQLENAIKASDLVISGEGKLDAQSLNGKVVGGISDLCKKYEKPLYAFVGSNELSLEDLEQMNIKGLFSLLELTGSEEKALAEGDKYLTDLGYQFAENHVNEYG